MISQGRNASKNCKKATASLYGGSTVANNANGGCTTMVVDGGGTITGAKT